MGFIHHFLHAVAAVLAIGASVIHAPLATNVSAGMEAGPACATHTLQPGQSASVPVSVVNSANGWEKLNMSVQQIGPPAGPAYPAGGYPLPASWVSFSGAGWVQSQHTAIVQATVNVPAGAKRGRYGALVTVTATTQESGVFRNGHTPPVHYTIGFGAGAGTWFEVSVGVSPPPEAFCRGERVTYWPWVPPLPVCKAGQPPVMGRQAVCRVLPLPPPSASAKNCHMTPKAWADYMAQMRIAVKRYHASMADTHCWAHGQLLNTPTVYHKTGLYRFPD